MREIKPFVRLIPFIMIACCSVIYPFGYYHWFDTAIKYLSQIVGCSIITNIFFIYFIRRNNMCTYSLVATIGLLMLNILDIINLLIPFNNAYFWYMGIVSIIFLFGSIVFMVKIKI